MTENLLEATISVRGVILTNRGETLVVKRATDGVWELPGGRLGPQENVVSGLKREITEETTLDIEVEGTVHANTWRNDDNDGRFAVYYRCRAKQQDVKLSEEHDTYRWVSCPQAKQLLPRPQEVAAQQAYVQNRATLTTELVPTASSD